MKAYWVQGTEKAQVSITPVTVTLSLSSYEDTDYEVLLYKANIGQDIFLFPSEWGRQGFGFDHRSEQGLFLAYTNEGIWRIDPTTMSAELLTADTYQGKTIDEVQEDLKTRLGEHLAWVDRVEISPDGKTVVYRTNRDTDALNNTSIWKLDLDTAKEEQLLTPAYHNDLVGFLFNDCAVVGSLENTRMVEVSSGKVTALEFPELPNFDIKGVGDGKVVFSSYANDDSDSFMYVSQVNEATGTVTELTHVTGYFSGTPVFSPAGDKIAMGYGTDPEYGTDDVMIVDTKKSTQVLLSESSAKRAASSIQSQKAGKIDIMDFCWLDDDTIVIEPRKECARSNVVANEPISDQKVARSSYIISFGSIPPTTVDFVSPLLCYKRPKSTINNVNSKWSQPRSEGTNPHNGVDLFAYAGTPVYAPYAGWVEWLSIKNQPYDFQLLVDANNNQKKDDGDYYVRFYHMNSREDEGYKKQGELIGKSGNQNTGGAHLHFGICSLSGGLKWLRNEVNYRYLANENNEWNAGKDLDIYAYVSWDHGTASLDAYIMNDGYKEDLAAVEMYYRTTPSGKWIEGGTMQKSGDTYSYNFREVLPTGTTVYWMVRLTRSGISQRAFCPAKYFQPDADPNYSAEPYDFFTNVV